MHHTIRSYIRVLCAVLGIVVFSYAYAATTISWSKITSGGGISNGGNIQLVSSIGQVSGKPMSGGNISLTGQFSPPPPIPELIFVNGFEQP